MSGEAMPLSKAAREKRRDLLRDQQRREAELLARVSSEEDRLAAEQHRTEQAVATARAKLARQQAALEAAIVALADTCGTARAAVLVERSESEVARLQRARRRTSRDEPA